MILDGHFGTKILRWPYGSRTAIAGLPHIAWAVPYGNHKGLYDFYTGLRRPHIILTIPAPSLYGVFACQM